MVYKRAFLFFWVLCLWAQVCAYATQESPLNSVKKGVIRGTKHFSGMDFRNRPFPENMAGANLTNANCTGLHFSHIDFTDVVLQGVILTNTTCDYQKCFEANKEAKTSKVNKWYLEHVPKGLKSIAKVYPLVAQHSHKAALLQIASGLAYLPCYEGKIFMVKMQYWCCKLLLLKKQLKSTLGDQLACLLMKEIAYDSVNYCWKTDYPIHLEEGKGQLIAAQWYQQAIGKHFPRELALITQYYLTEEPQTKHESFDAYWKLFEKRLIKYNAISEVACGYNFYKETIKKNIQGLKKTYAKLTLKKPRKEAIDIALALSKSYKSSNTHFLCHYLACQNRLIKLQLSVGIRNGMAIHYNLSPYWVPARIKIK